MKPGTRVTWKYNTVPQYGTVIEPVFRDPKDFIFVVWDSKPDIFHAYTCEIRRLRKNEEIEFPEGT